MKKGKITLRTILMAIAFVVMCVSGVFVARDLLEARKQYAEERRIQELALNFDELGEEDTGSDDSSGSGSGSSTRPYHSPINFEALWEENPDVVGWIYVEGTKINNPILWREKDIKYYLRHDFEGNRSAYGSIFLDGDASPDFSSRNNPIYGHHMKDGTMFRALEEYKDPEFFAAHPYIDIYTPEKHFHLKVIGANTTNTKGIERQTQFDHKQDFTVWLCERLSRCEILDLPEGYEIPMDPLNTSYPVEQIFEFFTCSYKVRNTRTAVYAIEVGID